MANGFIGQVNIGGDIHLIGSTLFATSSTVATEPIKEAALQSSAVYSSTTGVTVHVHFDNANTVDDSTQLKLKLGSDSAYLIKNPNGALTWKADSIISFTFDGTNWVINSSAIDGSSIQNLSLGQIQSDGTLSTGSSLVVTNASREITTGVAFGSTKNGNYLDNTGNWSTPPKYNLVVGASGAATSNAPVAASTNSIYLNLVEDSAVKTNGSHNITGAGGITVASDSSGNITLTGKAGTVTSITLTQGSGISITNSGTAITSSGTRTISLADDYGDTKNPYASKTKNFVLAAPSNANGAPSFRALVDADIPAGIARLASPALSGTPTAPTASTGTNTTQIATTAFVVSEISSKLAANDAMLFKGTIGTDSGATAANLPAKDYQAGWTYRVLGSYTIGSGTSAINCEDGDLIIAINDGPTSGSSITAADWTVVQTNIDGAVTGPASSTPNHIATFSGTTGKVIKDSGITVTAESTGFKISGGTTSKTLTVTKDITLGDAAAKGYTDSSSASAISTGTSLVTERDVYYGLPTINNSHSYTSSTTIYAPTSAGTAGQYLKASGNNSAPVWETFSASTVGLGSVSNDANLNGVTGAKGDLIYWSAANTPARLAASTDGYVLTLDSGVPSWKSNAATDKKLEIEALASASATTNYLILGSGTAAAIRKYTTALKYVSLDGTTSTAGYSELHIGNATTSKAAGGATGSIYIYGTGTKYTKIVGTANTADITLTLPLVSASGNLVGTATTSTVGSNKKPVYIAANGVATAIDFTIEKNVPSNAVFTDTHYTSAGYANALTSLYLTYTTTAAQTDTITNSSSTATALGYVNGGILYIKSIYYDTTSVSTDVTTTT